MTDSDRQTDNWGCQNHREKERKGKGYKNKLTLSDILIGQSCSLGCQESNGVLWSSNERGGQNLREKGEKGKGKLLERW